MAQLRSQVQLGIERCHHGYILVETLVAMALLSVCMLVIYNSLRDAALMRGLAEDYTTARFLLEQVATEHELQPEVVEGSGSGAFPVPDHRFSYSWQLTRVPVPMLDIPPQVTPEQQAQLDKGFKKFMGRLSVRIRWDRAGTAHEVTGETLLQPGQLWTPPSQI
ncbi:MAG: prepilin-type N-terminal cleavage/methylation domain-containing protein [Candidatus Hydrogenedentes bacterium]|nr:prepilin-type N-terminal cleavage/methylation domain-containing protein [Candidatus Hydrogenedentota bacterium]